jgi:hypothetical protein
VTTILPLAFALSSPAWGWDDCGLVEGGRYLVTRAGLHPDDETVIADWGRCEIPVGCVLWLAVAEEPPRVVIDVVPPCEDAAAWTERQVGNASAYLASHGYAAEQVDTVVHACSAAPHVDVRF